MRSTETTNERCRAWRVAVLVLLLAVTLVCGYSLRAGADGEVTLSSYSMTLSEDIGLRVYVTAPASADVSVRFTYLGRTVQTQATDRGDGRLCADFHGLAPQHLGEPLTVELYNGTVLCDTRTLIPEEYLQAQRTGGTYATADALLTYAAVARIYEGLSDEAVPDTLPERIDVPVPIAHASTPNDAAYRLYRLGLVLSNTVSAYVDVQTVTGDVAPTVTVCVDGHAREATLVAGEQAGTWRVMLPVKASELCSAEISVSVRAATGSADTVVFGAAAYLHTLAEEESGALRALARAIYAYGTAAEDLAAGHNYRLVAEQEANCGAEGVRIYACDACGDVYGDTTPMLDTHTALAVAVVDGQAVYRCEDCGMSFVAESSSYAMGDVMSENFRGSTENVKFHDQENLMPTAVDESGNLYYSLVRGTGEKTQVQFYAPNETTASEAVNRMGFLSLRLRQPSYGLESGWSLQLYNSAGSWGGHAQNNAKGLSVLVGRANGEIYMSNKDKNNVQHLATLKTDAWTRFDVLFEKVNGNLVLTYFVDGERVGAQTIPNTLRDKTPCGIYFTGSTTKVGSAMYIDDIMFAYTDTPREDFLLDGHTYETVERIAPTCYRHGYEIKECTQCEQTLAALLPYAHELGEPTVTPPSCFTEGVTEAVCIHCRLTVREVTPAVGSHSFGSWTTVKTPTATADGLQQRTCSVCNTVEEKTLLRLSASNINTLYLSGDWQSATKTNDVTVTVDYVPTEGEGFSCYGEIHWQGASSLSYPEKNYTIKLYKDEALTSKNKVNLGWGKENKYCLKANWVDSTSARNIVSCRLWADVVATRPASALRDRLLGLKTNAGAIDGFPIAVYMNGSFHGIYTLNVPKDEWMFDMDDVDYEAMLMANDWNNSTFRTTVGNFALDSNGDWVANGGAWELKYFGTEKTTGSSQWVTDSFNELIRFCQRTQNDGAAFRAGIDQYLDMDATIDYLLFFYAIYMRDNSAKNILWATYDGKVWFPSVYDLDGTFGQAWDGIREATPTGQLPTVLSDGTIEDGIYDHDSLIIWNTILNEYSEEILDRYYQLRESVLTEEHMESAFAEFLAEIPDDVLAADRNKWSKPGNGKFEWDYIDQWIPKRLAAMDEAMGKMAKATGYVK